MCGLIRNVERVWTLEELDGKQAAGVMVKLELVRWKGEIEKSKGPKKRKRANGMDRQIVSWTAGEKGKADMQRLLMHYGSDLQWRSLFPSKEVLITFPP